MYSQEVMVEMPADASGTFASIGSTRDTPWQVSSSVLQNFIASPVKAESQTSFPTQTLLYGSGTLALLVGVQLLSVSIRRYLFENAPRTTVALTGLSAFAQ